MTTPGGTSATSGTDLFAYDPVPVVTGTDTPAGPLVGGTVVTVTGTGFLVGATTAAFGGSAAAVACSSTTSCAVTSPPGAAGTVDITLTTAGGTSALSVSDQFTYEIVPTVTSVAPDQGPTAGNTTVTITGTGFVDTSDVEFGAGNPANFTVTSPTSVSATLPPGAAGTVDVTLTTPGGANPPTVSDQFTYFVAPAVTSVAPAAGPAAGGTAVAIDGSGFVVGGTTATFGGVAATVSCTSATTCAATSPPGAAGTVDIVLATAGGTSATGGPDQFTYENVPAVTGVLPDQGPAVGGGAPVVITGTDLVDTTTVTFGAGNPADFTVDSDTRITATLPPGTAGTVDVIVTTPGGPSVAGPADRFTYDNAPTVTAIAPADGPLAGGTTVALTGTGFIPGSTTALFGTTPAAVTCATTTTCSTSSPVGTAGTVDITVTTPGGTSATGAADLFTYLPTPAVTAVSPAVGPVLGGTAVTVTGTDFVIGATTAAFGTAGATAVTCSSSSTCTATSPAEAAGSVDITLTTDGGTSAASGTATDQFTFYNDPAVTGVAPDQGPTAGGTAVTVTGTGLAGATAVTFGGTPATFAVTSDTAITATAPAGTPGPVDITVTTPGGTSSAGASDLFTYDAVPTVTGLSPAEGPTAGGTAVVVSGTDFIPGSTSVSFGGVPATGVSCSGPTACAATSPGGSGPVDVTVTTPGGTSAATGADIFTYDPVPVVSAVAPAYGPVTGGTPVTVTGTGFTASSSVSFGTTPAAGVVVTNPTTLVATTAPATEGPVDVTVTTAGGTSATGSGDLYTFQNAPTVTSVVPSQGPTSGGPTVSITGTDLTGTSTVDFGPSDPATFTVTSPTSITATLPPGAAGTVDVTVTTSSGTSASGASDRFTFDAAPSVTHITPSAGPVGGGTSVTVTGTGFLAGSTTVAFGTGNPATFTFNSSTQLTATAPTGTAGPVDITVTTPGGTSATGPSDVFSYATIPTITAVVPPAGPTAGGIPVVITGTGLTGATAVTFGTGKPAAFVVNSPTQITATAPSRAAGLVDIRITTPGGATATTAADQFTYLNAPVVTGVAPSAGPVTGATPVTVSGTGFVPGSTTVSFGGAAATATCSTTTACAANSPGGSPGSVNVTVTTPAGTSATSGADLFTYDAVPTVTALSPTGSPTGGGVVVTLTGTGFVTGSTGTTVKFGTAAGTVVSCSATTTCVATAPAGTAGTVDVTATTAGGTSATGAPDRFTYVTAPAVTGVAPTLGPTSGGTAVVITGTGLAGATAVNFGTGNGAVYVVNSATQITATLPSRAAGTVNITVTTPGGTSPTTAADQFTYDNAPTVTGIVPTGGGTGGSTVVTVTGTGFVAGSSTVAFGAAPAAATVNSATQISATAPAGSAGTVDITVTTPGGTSATGSADRFTYFSAPVVTGIAPAQGPTAGGTSVVITGTSLSGATGVSFGTTPATLVVNSSTQITAKAPARAAGAVDITVTTPGGTSATGSADLFTYVNAPAVTLVAPAAGPLGGGTSVVVTGTAFVPGATTVAFGGSAATAVSCTTTSCAATSPPGGAGTVDVRVTTPGGTSSTTAADSFTYDTAPTVGALAPAAGPLGGGTVVTVTGTGFVSGTVATTVAFGGSAATGVSCATSTTCTATGPSGAAGPADVTVTTAGGTSATGSADLFSYDPVPTVATVAPDQGPTAGGTAVVLTGTGLAGTTAVAFGAGNLATFTVNSATQITATLPSRSAGTVLVSVTTPGGTSATPAADQFTYEGVPAVTAVAPAAGPVGGGTAVTVTGTGFVSGATAVSFAGVAATGVNVSGATSLTATSPAGSAGVADVTVATPGGTSATGPSDRFTYTALPTVSSVVPAAGPLGGINVVITGTGFVTGTTATSAAFGSVGAVSISCTSSTSCAATAPAQPAGTVHVTVTTPGGTSTTSPADQFTYVAAPSVSGVAPGQGTASGGTSVVITGTNLSGVTAVEFGTSAATSFTATSTTSVTATSPSSTGTVDITVVTPGGTSPTSGADLYTFDPVPLVTGVAPAAGPTGGGTSVTITGSGFVSGSTTVAFGTGNPALAVVNSATQITASSPAGTAGTVDVAVTTPGGTSPVIAADHFTYDAPPAVSGVAPVVGPTSGATSVVITGTNLSGVTAVDFGAGRPATYVANSATRITASSPPESAGTVDITVATPGGTSATGPSDTFTYFNAPSVTQVTPAAGPVAGGVGVTVTGTGFVTGSTTLSFGGAPATGVACTTATTCTATTPAGTAGAVDVTATTAGGPSATSPADVYTYETVPTVSAVSPAAGPLAGGTVVTVTGTGFVTGATSVAFGAGSPSTTVSVTSTTTLTATAPAAPAGPVDILVTTAGGNSTAGPPDVFSYDPVPAVGSVAPAAGPLAGGTAFTLTGSGFVAGTTVAFGSTPATSVVPGGGGTTLAGLTPAHAVGTVYVTVTTPGGSSSTGPASQFAYQVTPAVTGLSPAAGPLAGSTPVTVTGSGFVAGATTVSFGGVPATGVSCTSASACAVTAPAGPAGTVDVTVTTPGGTSATGSPDRYTYDAAPAVTALAPTAGPVAGGTVVTVTGTAFVAGATVSFGSTPSAVVTVTNATTLQATAPAASAGGAAVTVTTPGGTSPTGPADIYSYDPVPSITGVSPAAGPLAGGTVVTVSGSGFVAGVAVSFGATPASSITVTSGTVLSATAPAGTGTVDITAASPGGTSATSGADLFTYDATPTVTAIAPTSGPVAGGTAVTVTGSGFVAGTTVDFGAAVATGVTVTTSTSLVATTPTATAGAVAVTVANPGGTSATGPPDTFTYDNIPAVTAVTPDQGPVSGGTSVVIAGTDLAGASAVTFGPSRPAATFHVDSPTQITVTTPSMTPGVLDVLVTTPGGTSAAVGADQYTFLPVPNVTVIFPTSGPTTGGTSVLVSGTGFVPGGSVVEFGGTVAASVSCTSSTVCTATTPVDAAGVADVTVTTAGTTSPISAADEFTFDAGPTVTAVSPAAGPAAGGTAVIVTGTGFTTDSATTVAFGTVPAASVTVTSTTSLTATAAGAAAGPVDIRVTTPGGTTPISPADVFTYDNVPALTGIAPDQGPVLGGTPVVLTGTDLAGVTTVDFGTTAAPSFTVTSSTRIIATLPAGPVGTVPVSVTSPGGTSPAGPSDVFSYENVPAVTGVTPVAGPTSGGTPVTLTGSGFVAGSTTVSFGGVNATGASCTSTTTCVATSPPGTAGAVDITVLTPGGTSATGPSDRFSYEAVPAVASITPPAGPTSGGTAVTVSGSGFTADSTVAFGTTPATSLTVTDATTLVAVSPAGTAGPVALTVTSPGGTSPPVVADSFTYDATPAVSAVSPSAGPLAGGTAVTVTGTGFTGDATVAFGTTPATSVTVTDATTLVAISPAGTGTVDLTVTNAGGTSPAVGSDLFTYDPAPTVTAVAPAAGPVAGGTPVTVTGSGFVAGTTVAFGTTPAATVGVTSTTSLAVTPAAATAGRVDVTVTTPGGTSTTGPADSYTFDNIPVLTAVAPDVGPTGGGTGVTLTGTDLAGTTSVAFGSTPATSFTVDSATRVTAVAPAEAAGTVDVVATTPGGTTPTGADAYTYFDAPTVTSVAPDAGPDLGGTTVAIAGTGFVTGGTSVSFGGVAAAPVACATSISCTVTSPPTATGAGPVDVTVTTPGGTSTAVPASDTFTYDDVPAVTSVAPAAGPLAGGTTVTVTGATSITATAPAGSAGTVDVTVTTPGGTSALSAPADSYTYEAVPVVSAITPAGGSVAGGTLVTVTGSGFVAGSVVSFGSVPSATVVLSGASRLTALSPVEATGTVDITVTTLGGTSALSAADQFAYENLPSVTAVSPAAGPLSGGTTVDVSGSGFVAGATTVSFGTTASASVTVTSATSLTARSPAGVAGPVDVTASTYGGTSATGPSDTFTYEAVPTVTGITPAVGPLSGGTAVTVTGTGFTPTTAVAFGAVAASSVTVTNATTLTATSPGAPRPPGRPTCSPTTPGPPSPASARPPARWPGAPR